MFGAMKSHLALKNFVDYWRGKPGFAINALGLCTFNARVTYTFRGTKLVHTTGVMIQRNGYEDGKVSLEEAGPLVAEVFHLDFLPKWQRYSVGTRSHSLIIKGSSQKMGGEYVVVIMPVRTQQGAPVGRAMHGS